MPSDDFPRGVIRRLERLQRILGVELVVYDEVSDGVPFGAEVIQRLETLDASGADAGPRRPPARLTPTQVAKLVAIEDRHHVRVVAFDPQADQVIHGTDLIEELAEAHGIDI